MPEHTMTLSYPSLQTKAAMQAGRPFPTDACLVDHCDIYILSRRAKRPGARGNTPSVPTRKVDRRLLSDACC
eukprot:1159987-Pelagomonas_calceolata.AAC.5